MNPFKGRLLTIAEVAKEAGIPKRTMYRRLKQLDEMYEGRLLIKQKSSNGKWLVRESVLLVAASGFEIKRDQTPVPRYEFEALFEALRQAKKQLNAQGARIRVLEKNVKSMPMCNCRCTTN